ncbi:glutathione S-transferase family protein [Duganella sp. S19_KUP01_CR8]|uniref:glutathione S-transferase family protein n=1 Tax=Duganella sp. S19_KUP01_CR8 TaxID=3025502 RepID=UPI002FCD81A0
MATTLIIGDYAKSSWSLRAWLVLHAAGLEFETVQVALDHATTKADILRYSPSGMVPALGRDGIVINDSLAISEAIAEACPQARLWPADARVRALARAAAAEMHAGFTHLRTQMSFGLDLGDDPGALSPDTEWEIQRVFQIWRGLQQAAGGGPFLCGEFGIVDAMYVPVVFRFRRYGVAIPADLQGYVAAILDHRHVQQWQALAVHSCTA